MAIGDTTNNIRRLMEIKYPDKCDLKTLAEGNANAYLPIYLYHLLPLNSLGIAISS